MSRMWATICKNHMNILYKQKRIFLVVSLLVLLFAFIPTVFAGKLGDAFGDNLEQVAGPGGAGYRTDAEPETLVGEIIAVVLSFLGVVFLILMIYGGFLWMTAGGSEQQVEKAKKLITAAIIGLIVVVSAYAISHLLVTTLGDETLEDM